MNKFKPIIQVINSSALACAPPGFVHMLHQQTTTTIAAVHTGKGYQEFLPVAKYFIMRSLLPPLVKDRGNMALLIKMVLFLGQFTILFMPDTKRILSEFQKAINFYAKSQVVDLDANFNEKFEFHALRLEKVFRVSKRVPPNRWSFHRIGIITQGSGEFQTGIYRFPARKNTLVVVPARVMTSSCNWSDNVQGLLALFNLQFLRKSSPYKFGSGKKILTPYIKPYVYLNEEQANNIIKIFETILKEQSEKNEHREELISLKVIELIIECERLFTENNNIDKDFSIHSVVTNFTSLLEKHFHEQHSASFYASKLNLHPNYLNSLVKKYTNETTKESINNRVLIEIKYLLHSTSLSIKEIANRVGFSDPNYLASFFKRMEKISPVVYRSANSKELIFR